MFFTLLLGLSALLVAGSAAYFSVLGIATLFAGSYFQVMFMASCLEFGKLIATSYLYRYWNLTVWWLKTYLVVAIMILMFITSLGIFGFLSAAYQVNSSKFSQIDSQIALLDQQKKSADSEIAQNISRIEVLNKSRLSQEQRLPSLSRQSAAPIYADMERSTAEIKSLNERSQALAVQKNETDSEIIKLTSETIKTKDIGTFKFIAQTINQPLDTIVIAFICVLIGVFDPLAVSLVLAFNVAKYGAVLKTVKENEQIKTSDEKPSIESDSDKEILEENTQIITEVSQENGFNPIAQNIPSVRHIGLSL